MIADLHVHTKFSCDSEAEMEQYAKKALEKNCSYICFTDHVDFNKNDYGCGYYSSDKFFEEFSIIRKKYSNHKALSILSGIEFSEPHLYKNQLNTLKEYPYDYIIGSIHWVKDMFPNKEVRDKYSANEFYEMYWDEVLEAVKAGGFDCLGHIDFPKRYYMETIYEPNLLCEIFDTMIGKNIVLEINTSSLRKGITEPMPGKEILNIYKQCGGKFVTIGSDAHEEKDLLSDYFTAQKLIENMKLQQVFFIKHQMKIL